MEWGWWQDMGIFRTHVYLSFSLSGLHFLHIRPDGRESTVSKILFRNFYAGSVKSECVNNQLSFTIFKNNVCIIILIQSLKKICALLINYTKIIKFKISCFYSFLNK